MSSFTTARSQHLLSSSCIRQYAAKAYQQCRRTLSTGGSMAITEHWRTTGTKENSMVSGFKKRDVSVIGAPFAAGQPLGGVDLGPTALRQAGLIDRVRSLGHIVQDLGDVEIVNLPEDQDCMVGNVKNPRQVGRTCQNLASITYEERNKGNAVITLGGDHSVALGSISGILRARPDTCVLWLDAHADINIPEESPSGNAHGMPVAFMMGLAHAKSIPGFEWTTQCLSPARIAYVGLRDLDTSEKRIIREAGIAAYTMFEIDKYGIGKVIEMALNQINPYNQRSIHLSFDIDCVDPSIAGATGTKVMGGLTYREAHFVAESMANTGMLASMDLVEVNPKLESKKAAEFTTELGVELIESAFGKRIL